MATSGMLGKPDHMHLKITLAIGSFNRYVPVCKNQLYTSDCFWDIKACVSYFLSNFYFFSKL